MNNTEVITLTDKDKRDEIYDEFRRTGNRFEKQVVKFSSYESIRSPFDDGKTYYRSTWSIAYPKS